MAWISRAADRRRPAAKLDEVVNLQGRGEQVQRRRHGEADPAQGTWTDLRRLYRIVIAILWGKSRNKTSQVYGCPSNWNRGETVCKNTARIRRDDLERVLLAGLQSKILREEVVDYVMERFETRLLKELESMTSEMDRMESRKHELERELENLTKALASGQLTPTIMAAIAEREKEIADITDRVISSSADSIKARVQNMRVAAKSKLRDLRGLLSGDVTTARAALLKHVQKIEMDANGKVYVAKGNWNLLGQAGERPTDGAGGPACTILPQAKFFVDLAA